MVRWLACLGMGALLGCSVLVDPDEGELGGGVDGGGVDSGIDAGTSDGGGLDAGPCPGGCDDGVACTVDTCTPTGCVNQPFDDMCPVRCDRLRGCVEACDGDEDCNDGIDCTVDRCGAEGCTNAPRDGMCNDGIACTADRCDPGAGCVGVPNDAACADGNACTLDVCTPGLGCEYGVPGDADGDGFPGASPVGCDLPFDCNDADGFVYPGAPERCNGIDDDCDGFPEEMCRPGDDRRCDACDGRWEGRQECSSTGCGYEACGDFEVRLDYDPGGRAYTHACGFQCGLTLIDPDWCVRLDPGENCDAITAGPGVVVPPGRYEVEIDWSDRGAWTFIVSGNGTELARTSGVNTSDGTTTTRLEITVTMCTRLDLRVTGGSRIRIRDTRFTRIGEP